MPSPSYASGTSELPLLGETIGENLDRTSARFGDPARWMHTGDLAVMPEHGYLNVVGRIKDMVIRGGEKTSPTSRSWACRTRATARSCARGSGCARGRRR